MKKVFLLTLLFSLQTLAYAEEVMYAHYINMGQADATLLEFPCGAVLIDAGAQKDNVQELKNYLTNFFQKRTDLNNTLDAVIITHNHIDHTRALKDVVQNFTIKNYIDNGQSHSTGTGNPNWLKREVAANQLSTTVTEIADTDITALTNKVGLTNNQIDPINCTNINPQIRILSGRLDENPGWSHRDFDNKNNHSLVIRIDFGQASFLFSGDLQEPAIETLVDYYASTSLLDTDVFQVGHHGSHNATTKDLLEAITPDIAVISMGHWQNGQGSNDRYTTWWYGHPRKDIMDMLSLSIKRKRSYPVEVAAAEGSRNFQSYTVKDAIYGTGWYGTLKVRATESGRYRVTHIQ